MNGTELAISLAEAGKRIGVSQRTIWNFVLSGQLKTVKLGRRRVGRIHDLNKFLEHDHVLRGTHNHSGKASDGAK